MNLIMPFSKEIKFNNSIGEITSISLEHEYNLNAKVILGNFYVSGSYKVHELSVNTEDFSYTLPFDLTLNDNIDETTLKFDIDNFTYEVIDSDSLRVDIDYKVCAKEKIIEKIIFEKEPVELDNIFREEIKEDKFEEIEEDRLDETSQNNIIDIASNNEETFITYKAHILKEGENLETLCVMYNKNEQDIIEYNQNIKFNPFDKILIPEDE